MLSETVFSVSTIFEQMSASDQQTEKDLNEKVYHATKIWLNVSS